MSRRRKEKMTQISIGIPDTLVELIDKMAALDSRTRSNFITKVLRDTAKGNGNNATK